MQQIKGQPEHLGLPKKRGIAPFFFGYQILGKIIYMRRKMNFSTIRCWDALLSNPSVWMELAKEMDAWTPSGGATYTHRGTCSPCSWAEHWRHSKAPVPSTSSGPRAQGSPLADSNRVGCTKNAIRTNFRVDSWTDPTNLMVTWCNLKRRSGLGQKPCTSYSVPILKWRSQSLLGWDVNNSTFGKMPGSDPNPSILARLQHGFTIKSFGDF